MREKILVTLLILAAAIVGLSPRIQAQDAASKAQELLKQARAAIGGEKLRSLNSLSATGNYRRTMGDRDMTGEVQFDLILPDKMMRTETLSPVPNMEITRIEAVSGDNVWSDQQSSGMGGGMIFMRRPSDNSPQGLVRQQNSIRAELTRVTLGWLLAAPSSFPVEFTYAGQAEAPDGKAEVLDVKGLNGFTARLFLDQQTHKPLMLTYKGRKPQIITRQAGPPGNPEELEKRMKEVEAEALKQPEVEFQIRFSDYHEVNGISLPHRLTRAMDGEINEEWEITKFKINPSLKPEKFEKK